VNALLKSTPFSFRLLIFVLTLACLSPAQGAPTRVLPGHVPAGVARLRAVNRLPGSDHLALALGLPLRNREALTNLLQQIYDPASPNYHRYLTPEQFATQFGPTEQDYQAVIAFAKTNGLTVTGTHPNRVLLDVSGPAANIEQAFRVKLHVYNHPKEARTFYAPDVEPSLDPVVPVLSVSGLDDFVLPRPANLRTSSFDQSPNATPFTTGSGPRGNFIGKDFRAAYAPDVSLDGSGQSVGLVEFDGYYTNDVIAYASLAGLPNVPLTNILLNPQLGAAGANNLEVVLDIDMAISMAPGLSRVLVYEGRIGNNILNRMATDNLARQLSCSWTFGSPVDATRAQIFQQFAAQGQSFFQASGDSGAYSGPVSPPVDDPFVTAVGGTALATTGPGGPWSSESAWFAGGGGISTSYPIPVWQQSVSMSANQGSTAQRNTPDVACLADGVIWLIGNNGEEGAIGGTSAAAPLWAGFAALVNQQAAANGQPSIGFVNPAIYAIGQSASYGACFHDITTGNNTNSSSPTKFFAVPGYDLCTGWGTPNGNNLIQALLPPPDALRITPGTGFAASGPAGGPFNPNGQSYALTNSGAVALGWTLVNTSLWLNASSSNGTLAAGGPANLVTLGLNSGATNLLPGTYVASVWFTNLNDGFAQSRQFTLNVINTNSVTAPGIDMATVYSFTGGNDGSNPNGLMQAANGNFYGTTQRGGTNSSGTAFQMTPAGALTQLYSFTGGDDGASPYAALAQASDGTFYGTTFQGGGADNGTLFKMTGSGALATLVSFNGTNNGGLPFAGLTPGLDGNFYGTTYQGGTGLYGTVFKTTTNGLLTTLISFNNSGKGGLPYGGVVRGLDGNFYGTTWKGGASGNGTVFKMATNGILTTLVSFAGTNGANPYAGLVAGTEGDFYGVTANGGASSNGTVFKITAAGAFTNLYSFTGGSDGSHPAGALIEGGDGNYYGTTAYGGAYGNGTVFWMAPNGTPASLVQFAGYNGANPEAALVQGTDGSFYGTTQNGGASGQGAVFRFSINSPLQITSQPAGQTNFAGATVFLNVATFGSLPVSYQWRQNGTNLTDGGNLSGAATHTLMLSNITTANAATYSVIASNASGPVTSLDALLGVIASPPFITLQPTNQTLRPGMTATLSAAALGNLPLSYQWRKNGTNLTDAGNLSGAATSTLTLSNVIEATSGTYSLMASNVLGSVSSTGAVLSVVPVSAPGTILATVHVFTGGTDGGSPNGLVRGADGSLYGTTQFGGSNHLGATFKVATNGTMTTLASFTGVNGSNPQSALAAGADGNLYGTTRYGGLFGEGTTFKLTPGGTLASTYSFTGDVDGANPCAQLLLGADGNFYGTTSYGGTYGAGNVFEMSPNGMPITLYSFTGGRDGGYPIAALAQGTDGNFYGTTPSGGTNAAGNVFRMAPNGTLTNLYSFTGLADGSVPAGALVQGTDGNFYSTTKFNTIQGFLFNGTIFRVTTNGALTTLYALNFNDGANPVAGLIQGGDGNFYGTTLAGGPQGNGTVFRISPNGAIANLVQFDGFDDGAHPASALVQGSDGSFYGTTTTGGPGGRGTVFRLSINSAPQITTQPANQNAMPGTNVVFNVAVFGTSPLSYQWRKNGTNLLGGGSSASSLTISNVAPADAGTYSVVVTNALGSVTSTGAVLSVVSVTAPGINLDSLYSFTGNDDGGNPNGLVQATNGIFYGTTQNGGTNLAGTVFQMSPSGALAPLYSFTGDGDGANPFAALMQGADGNLYGTTFEGGTFGPGAVFKITTNGALAGLYSFAGINDGGYPVAALVQGKDGNFYGTASAGGQNGNGTVFKLTTNGAFTTLRAFKGTDGASPQATLVQGADGSLYGSTRSGGTNGNGTAFKITTNGTFTLLRSFNGTNGANPNGLVLGGDGNLYGTTAGGGTNGNGTLFKLATNGTLTTLYAFSSLLNSTNTDGANPAAALVPGTDGNFYGTTQNGGRYGDGTVFRISPLGTLTTLGWFAGLNGANPEVALVQGTDGNFYGTTQNGGATGMGVIFRLSVPLPPVFQSVTQANGALTFRWSAVALRTYQLQYTTNLTQANWSNSGSPVSATNGMATGSALLGPDVQRFYRVMALP
jgi:uncharacterized repeat protein (TIGR03803 family)